MIQLEVNQKTIWQKAKCDTKKKRKKSKKTKRLSCNYKHKNDRSKRSFLGLLEENRVFSQIGGDR